MKRLPTRFAYFVLVVAFFALWLGWSQLATADETPTDPTTTVETAWQRANQSGAYEYSTNIVQQTTPQLTLDNVGLGSTTERLYLEGSHDRASETMSLRLWGQDGNVLLDSGGLEIKVEHGRALARTSTNDWQEVDSLVDFFAPGQDPLGFLSAATNTQEISAETVTADMTATHYQFDLSGPAFARYMRDQFAADMRREGKLPQGIELGLATQFVQMTGTGELWLDADGLPLRQTISVAFPPEKNQQVTAVITTDFRNWATLSVAPTTTGNLFQQGLASLNALQINSTAVVSHLSLILLITASLALMLRHYRSPHFYNGLVLLLIFSMVAVPLLQATEVGAFYDTIYAEQTPPTPQQDQSEPQPTSPFDPHQDPLSRFESLPTAVSITTNPPPELPLYDNGQDSDSDGLTDAQEIFIESDPNNPDQDGDTLTDGIEVLELGSSIHAEFGADTDGDGLTDDAEIGGFEYAGQTWYLDFSNPDSNGDGLPDGMECTQDSTTRALTCPDSDGDNVPDAFDDDNDNDGVPDRNDLDSDHVVGDRTNGLEEGLFRYGFSELNADRPVYVDFQLRPTNPDRLWYTLNVLDWPSNDRNGQVQRVFDTTFGDTGELADGDLRLVPMLEIEIPFDPANGQYGNLPIKESAPPITAVTPLEDWLDTAVTRSFGLTIRQGTDNNLYAYVPLNLVRPSGDTDPVAFSGRMFYQPQDSNGDTLADWGDNHQASMVWLVEAITDRCLDEIDDDFEPDISDESERRQKWCADNDNWVSNGSSIIHVYRDDWYLTGLQVREEAGTSVAVAFQDPAYTIANYPDLTGFYEDSLWTLAQGLDSSFIAGRADGDNARTLVLDDIVNRWDNGSTHPDHQDDTKRWDIPADALIVERYDFDHQALLGSMAVTNTAVLLDNYFTGTAIQDPTLLFAREEKYRVLSLTVQEQLTPLDGATWQNGQLDGNGLLMAVSETAAPPLVVVGMSWSPFRDLGGGWETYPLAEYWEDHETVWETTLSETWGDPDELFGASLATSSFYMTMVHGLTALAEIDGLAAGSVSSLSDDFLQTELRAQTASALSTAVSRWSNIMSNSASFTSGTGSLLDNFSVTASGTLDWTRPVFELGQIKEIANTNYRIFKGQRDAAWLDDLRNMSPNRFSFEANANVVGNHLPATTYKVAKVSAAVDQAGLFVGLTTAALQLTYEILLIATHADRVQALDGLFAAINLALASVSVVAIYSNLKLAVALQALQVGSTSTAVKNVVNEAVKQASLSVGAIVALIVIAAVQIGIFTYLILSEGIKAFSLEFNLALAGVVASLIVVVLLVALAAIPLVGQLIAAIIALIDTAIAFICIAAGVNSNEDWVGQWLCPGINGLLTKAVQWLVYDQSPIVDLIRGDRLQLADLQIDLVDKNLGLAANNALNLSLDLGSALYAKEPDSPMSLIYFWQYGDNYVRDATLRYDLTRNQNSTSDALEKGQMRDEWLAPPSASDVWGSGSRFVYTTTLTTAVPVTLTQAGLNRPLNNVYIAEGQAIPVQECVLIPIPYGPIIVPTPTCWLRTDKNTTHIDLGSNLIFDVFPTTIDEFMALTARGDNQYALSWMTNVAAPTQADADGDGLRSSAFGGNDPNDSLVDTDGDGLSDYLEVKLWGTDPTEADIDGDGLTDAEEMRYGTNPYMADTDMDGLTDAEEIEGWEFVYGFADDNTPLTTWVWSDPLDANADGDDYLDGREKAFGFNPHVRSTGDLLNMTSTLADVDGLVRPGQVVTYVVDLRNDLRNRDALGLLGVDLPTAVSNASGLAPTPFRLTAQESLSLTGQVTIDNNLTSSQAVSLTNVAGAQAANLRSEVAGRSLWLKFDEASGPIFYDNAFNNTNASCVSTPCPTVNSNGYQNNSLTFARPNPFSDYTRYLTVDADLKELGFANDSYTVMSWIYLDSLTDSFNVERNLLSQASNAGSNTFELGFFNTRPQFGFNTTNLRAPNTLPAFRWHQIIWRYDRATNEHAIFVNGEKVLSRTDITYNYAALGGDTAVIGRSGTGSNYFDGRLDELEIFPYALSDSEIQSKLNATSDSGLVFYEQFEKTINGDCPVLSDDSPYSNDWRVARAESHPDDCYFLVPGTNRAGLAKNSYSFGDGDSDSDVLEVLSNPNLDLSRGDGRFALSVWLQQSSDAGGWIMGNNTSGVERGYPSLRVDGDAIETRFGLAPNNCSLNLNSTEVNNPDRWHHVLVTFDGQTMIVYLNGNNIGSQTCAGARPPALDTFFIGGRYNTQDGQGFQGHLDELRLFNHALSPSEANRIYWNTQPTLDVRFDEAPARTEFADRSYNDLTLTCSGATCPTSGVPGRAAQALLFDGVNDALPLTTAENLLLTDNSFTVSAWAKANGSGPVIGSVFAPNSREFTLGITANNRLFANINGNYNETNTAVITPGQWHHLVWRYEYDPVASPAINRMTLYVDGTAVGTYDGVAPYNQPNDTFHLGRFNNSYFAGHLDEVQIFSQALSTNDIRNLMRLVPEINLRLDERTAVDSFTNSAGPRFNATCTGNTCPQAGTKGRLYQGTSFDGIDDQLTLPDTAPLIHPAYGQFSVGLWVKPTAQRNGRQPLILKEWGINTQRTFGLFIEPNSMTASYSVQFCTVGPDPMVNGTAGTLIENSWNHLMLTYDRQNVNIYLNGALVEQQPRPADLFTPCYSFDEPIHIGNRAGYTPFTGELDEIVVYRTPLSSREVKQLVDYQANWFDTSYAHDLTIDADLPQISLSVDAPYLPARDQILAISAQDATSGIEGVVYSTESIFGPWEEATRDGEAWLFNFQPTPGEDGTYGLLLAAIDRAGNVEVVLESIEVDGTGPVLGAVNVEGVTAVSVQRDNAQNRWTIDLSGAVSTTGSPLDQIALHLQNSQGVPIALDSRHIATINGGGDTWQYDYPFPTRPNGVYTLTVTAQDQVGNSTVRQAVINIDGTPPKAAFTAPLTSTNVITSAFTLQGTIGETNDPIASGVSNLDVAFQPMGWDDRSSLEWLDEGAVIHLTFLENVEETLLQSGLRQFSNPTSFRNRLADGYHATCSGEPSCPQAAETGYYDTAVFFDGLDDTLLINQAGQSLSGQGYTLASWVRPQDGPFLSLSNGGQIAYDAGSQTFVYSDPTAGNNPTASSFPADQWHHVLLAVASDGTGTLYVNGTAEASFSIAVLPTATTDLRLGTDGNGNFYSGLLDDLALFERVLTAQEAGDHYRGFGAVLRLSFEQNSWLDGQPMPESSRFAHTAVLNLGTESATAATPGQVGAGALPFDGFDDQINIAAHPALDLSGGAFSQLVWLKPTAVSGLQPILHSPDAPRLGVLDGTRLQFGFGATSYTSPALLTPDVWHFVAVTFDGMTTAIYVNGVLRDSTDLFAGQTPPASTVFTIGHDGGNAYAGELDELVIIRQALPAADIATLFYQGWQTVTLAESGTDVPATTWQHAVPAGLRGNYRLQLRTADTNQNESFGGQSSTAWEGYIDTSAVEAFTLTLGTVGDGSATAVPDWPSYPAGTIVTVTATADPSNFFAGWSGDNRTATNPLPLIMNSDKTLTATFTVDEPTIFDLTVNTVGNGDITPSSGSYLAGTVITLTATPDLGHDFLGWTGDLSGTTSPISLTLDSDQTVTGTFAIQTFGLNVTAIGAGSITAVPDLPLYEYGTVVTLTAVADTGSSFMGWSGDATGASNPLTVTMTSEQSITGTFGLLDYDLSLNVIGNGALTAVPDLPVYPHGTVVTLTAVADTGHYFVGWTGNASGASNPLTVTVTSDLAITGTFAINQYDLALISVGDGLLTAVPDLPTYPHGTAITLTAAPSTGNDFVGWTGDATGADNPLLLTVTSDLALTGTFALREYALSVGTVGNGAVTAVPDLPSYPHGTVVTLTAVADPEHYFVGWGGDDTSANNPLTLTMSSDTVLTATFDLIPPTLYTLTMNTVGEGTVTPGSGVYISGTAVSLTADPAVGWLFDGWSGDLSGTTSPISVTMDSDKLITATFSPVEVASLTLTAAPGPWYANGLDVVAVTVQAQDGAGEGAPLAGMEVVLSGAELGSLSETSVVLDETGTAVVYLTAGLVPGTDTITATLGENTAVVDIPLLANPLVGTLDVVQNGLVFTFTLTVSNTGNVAQNNVVLTGTIPANTAFVSVAGGSLTGAEVATAPQMLAPQTSTTLVWTVQAGLYGDVFVAAGATSDSNRLSLSAERLIYRVTLPLVFYQGNLDR